MDPDQVRVCDFNCVPQGTHLNYGETSGSGRYGFIENALLDQVLSGYDSKNGRRVESAHFRQFIQHLSRLL